MWLNLSYYKVLNACIHIIVATGGIPKEWSIYKIGWGVILADCDYYKTFWHSITKKISNYSLVIRRRTLNFYCAGSLENYLGSVGLQNSTTTNSFKIDASKKKNIDHWDLETWVIMSAQVTYETDHTHVLLDSIMLWFNKFLLFC